MERIKDSPLAKNFYEFNDIDTPSLSKVEKKLNNYEYNSFYDFEMDIRKIWSYFFYLGEKGDKQIYENTSKMSEKWENICSELENANEILQKNKQNVKIETIFNKSEPIQSKGNLQMKDLYVSNNNIPDIDSLESNFIALIKIRKS